MNPVAVVRLLFTLMYEILNRDAFSEVHKKGYVFSTVRDFRSKAEEATDVHLNPLKILMSLEDVLSDNSILVADGGDFVATAAYILR